MSAHPFAPLPNPVHCHRWPFSKFESPGDWKPGFACMVEGQMALVEKNLWVPAGRGRRRLKVQVLNLTTLQSVEVFPCQLVRP